MTKKTPLGDLFEDEQLSRDIERLSDLSAGWADMEPGIEALGLRGLPGDIDRLVDMSLDATAPAYVHEWISEALLYVAEDVAAAKVLLDRCGPGTRALLRDMLCADNPKWARELRGK